MSEILETCIVCVCDPHCFNRLFHWTTTSKTFVKFVGAGITPTLRLSELFTVSITIMRQYQHWLILAIKALLMWNRPDVDVCASPETLEGNKSITFASEWQYEFLTSDIEELSFFFLLLTSSAADGGSEWGQCSPPSHVSQQSLSGLR